MTEGGLCTFSYSIDGQRYQPIGEPFQAVAGVWIGAKVGVFYVNPNITGSGGHADFRWFRVTTGDAVAGSTLEH